MLPAFTGECFALLGVWSTINGGLGFYFCYFGNAYSVFDVL